MKDRYVVAVGDAFNGMMLYGPFDSIEQAEEWAHTAHQTHNDNYWIVGVNHISEKGKA